MHVSPAQPLLVIPVLEARPLTYSSDNERELILGLKETQTISSSHSYHTNYCKDGLVFTCVHSFIQYTFTWYLLYAGLSIRCWDKVVRKVY